MNMHLDCIPCFIRQALEAVRLATPDETTHARLLRDVLHLAASMDLDQSPPEIGQRIHRHLRNLVGNTDPYRAAKKRFNALALEMVPALKEALAVSSDPLEMAIRLAIAGNVIDMGAKSNLGEAEVRRQLPMIIDQPLHGDVERFRRALASARSILYLTDNAGEIVFDRILIEQLGHEKVTVAVRGFPVINDATLEDAQAAGLCDLVPVISNGSDAPATILADCSDAFRSLFEQADLIIAKGQGNFESLSEVQAPIFFLFKAKCPVIARYAATPLGCHVVKQTSTILTEVT